MEGGLVASMHEHRRRMFAMAAAATGMNAGDAAGPSGLFGKSLSSIEQYGDSFIKAAAAAAQRQGEGLQHSDSDSGVQSPMEEEDESSEDESSEDEEEESVEERVQKRRVDSVREYLRNKQALDDPAVRYDVTPPPGVLQDLTYFPEKLVAMREQVGAHSFRNMRILRSIHPWIGGFNKDTHEPESRNQIKIYHYVGVDSADQPAVLWDVKGPRTFYGAEQIGVDYEKKQVQREKIDEGQAVEYETVLVPKGAKHAIKDLRRPPQGRAAERKEYESRGIAIWRGMNSAVGGVGPDKANRYPHPAFGCRMKTFCELWPDFEARLYAVKQLSEASSNAELPATAVQFRMAAVAEVIGALFVSIKYYVVDVNNSRSPKVQEYWGEAKAVVESMGASSGSGYMPSRFLYVTRPTEDHPSSGLLGERGTFATAIGGAFAFRKNTSPVLKVMQTLQDKEDAVYSDLLGLPSWKTILKQLVKFDRTDWPVRGDVSHVPYTPGDMRAYDKEADPKKLVSLTTNAKFREYLKALDEFAQTFTPKESAAHGGQASAAYKDILRCARRHFSNEEALNRVCYNGPNALPMSRVETFPRPEDMYVTVDGKQAVAPAGGMPTGATTIDDIGEGSKGSAVSDKATRNIRRQCKLNDVAELGTVAVMSKTDMTFFTALAEKTSTLDFATSWPATEKDQNYIPTFKVAWQGLFDGLDMQGRSRELTIAFELFDDLSETDRFVKLWDTLTAYHKKKLQTHSSGVHAGSAAIDTEAHNLLLEAKGMKQKAVIERYAREIMCLYDDAANRSKIHADIYVKVNEISKHEAKTFDRRQSEKLREQGGAELSVEDLRQLKEAVRRNTMQSVASYVDTQVADRRQRAAHLAKRAVYDAVDENVMKKVYEEELVEVKTKLTHMSKLIEVESQKRTAARHADPERGADPDEKFEQACLANDFAEAMKEIEEQFKPAGLRASATFVNHHDHLIEMLGPTKVDWKALLQNLADQIRVHHLRHGPDAVNSETMDFQVFPDPRTRHVSRNLDGLDGDERVDETAVLRSAVIEAADAEIMGEILLMCSETSERSKKRVMALHARGLMKLLEQGYNPARGKNKEGTPIGRAFTKFWNACKDDDLSATGRVLFASWSSNKKTKEIWGTTSTPDLNRLPADRIWIVQRVNSSRNKQRKRDASEVGTVAAAAGEQARVRTSDPAVPVKRLRGADPRRASAEDESSAMDMRLRDEAAQSDAFEFISEVNYAQAAALLLTAKTDEERAQIKRNAQLHTDAREQQITSLALRLTKLLSENTTGKPGEGLFRLNRPVYVPGKPDELGRGEGEYKTIGDTRTSRHEPLMTAQESLCAFQLVEMLVTIKTHCIGVFTPARTRYSQMNESQLGRYLRLGHALTWFDENYGSKDRAKRILGSNGSSAAAASSGAGVPAGAEEFTIATGYLAGSWDLTHLYRQYPKYYDELLKVVYRVMWQLREERYLEQKELYYPSLGSEEEAGLLNVSHAGYSEPKFEEERRARAAQLEEELGVSVLLSEVDMPYTGLAERNHTAEMSRLRRVTSFLITLTKMYKSRALDGSDPTQLSTQVATNKYLMEQITIFLRENDTLDSRVPGMFQKGLRRLAERDILVDTAEGRQDAIAAQKQVVRDEEMLEDLPNWELSYGLPSQQLHPIGYALYVALIEIHQDLALQARVIEFEVEAYNSAKKRGDTPQRLISVPAVRWLNRDEVDQRFYDNFMRMAILLSGTDGASSKSSFLPKRAGVRFGETPDAALVRELRDEDPENALLRPKEGDEDDPEQIATDATKQDLSYDVIFRRRNLNMAKNDKFDNEKVVGIVQIEIAKQYVDDKVAQMFQRHSMAMREAAYEAIESADEVESYEVPDPGAMGAVDARERDAYMLDPSRVGGYGKALHNSVRFDLVRYTFEADEPADEPPPRRLPEMPSLKDVVDAVDGAPPSTDAEKYPQQAFYVKFKSDPTLLYVHPLVKRNEGGSYDPNYATARAPLVFPPLGPAEVESAEREAKRRQFDADALNDPTGKGARVDRNQVLERILARQMYSRQTLDYQQQLHQLELDARAPEAMQAASRFEKAGQEISDKQEAENKAAREASRKEAQKAGIKARRARRAADEADDKKRSRSKPRKRPSKEPDPAVMEPKLHSSSDEEEESEGNSRDLEVVQRHSRQRRKTSMSNRPIDESEEEELEEVKLRPDTPLGDEEQDEEMEEEEPAAEPMSKKKLGKQRMQSCTSARPKVPHSLRGLRHVRFDEATNKWHGPPGSWQTAGEVWTMTEETRAKHQI